MSTHHEDEHHSPPSTFLLKYIFSTDHKVIGIQFLLTSLLFVIVGGLLALGVRYHIAYPGQDQPYAILLPGTGFNADIDGPKMTTKVPELNTASWKIDTKGKLYINNAFEVIEHEGQSFSKPSLMRKLGDKAAAIWSSAKKRTLPNQMRGNLKKFGPNGVEITILKDTLIEVNGKEQVVTEAFNALVSQSVVMPDPNTKVKNTYIVPGTDAKYADKEGTFKIVGHQKLYVRSSSVTKDYSKSLSLPVIESSASKNTIAIVSFEDQHVRIAVPKKLEVEFEGELLTQFEALTLAGDIDKVIAFFNKNAAEQVKEIETVTAEALAPYSLESEAITDVVAATVKSAANLAILDAKILEATNGILEISEALSDPFDAAGEELDRLGASEHHAKVAAIKEGRNVHKKTHKEYAKEIKAAMHAALIDANEEVTVTLLEGLTAIAELDPTKFAVQTRSINKAKSAIKEHEVNGDANKRDQLLALYYAGEEILKYNGATDGFTKLMKIYPLGIGAKLANRVETLNTFYSRQYPTDNTTIFIKGTTSMSIATSEGISYEINSLKDDGYTTLFTMHASVMIFFVIIPTLVGAFGNFLIPLMIGARDMAFPKLNMLAYWLALPAGLVMVLSFWIAGGAAGGGWTMYPTLSTAIFTPEMGTTLWVFGVIILGFSSITGSLNYITTVINMRAPGMSMFRMPLTVWSIFITSILILFSTPVLTAVMIMLFLDRTMDTVFFEVGKGGQPLLWQHLFWFYSHPAVYIMILPAMGVTSDVLATFSRKPIFGYKPMVFAMSAITGLGFIVWGHHMFQSGMNPVLGTTFMATTIMIAIPSAIKTFNWLGTLWGGNIKYTPPMLNALAFVSMFVIGGLSGIFMASAPVDIQIHDTYFIVGHIHYVLFGGSMFGIFAGVYYWYPKMFGKQMNQKWGIIHFILTFIGFNGTFFLMHVVGVGGHPRRYASIMNYETLHHLQDMNVLMTLFAMMLGMAQLPFFYNFFVSLPKKLSRATTIGFASMIIFPVVAGQAFWEVAKFGQSATMPTIYVIILLAVITYILSLCLTQLPTIGKVFSVIIIAPILLFIANAWMVGSSVSFASEYDLMAYDIIGALGKGVLAILIIAAVVTLIWEIGSKINAPAFMQRALYFLFLPAFFSPLIMKPDVWTWLGIPHLHPETCFEILAYLTVIGLPGLGYYLVKRPNDKFGYEVPKNVWNANSLEFVECSNPPEFINFHEIPTVYRGPYEFGSPVVDEDYLPQTHVLPEGVVEPSGH